MLRSFDWQRYSAENSETFKITCIGLPQSIDYTGIWGISCNELFLRSLKLLQFNAFPSDRLASALDEFSKLDECTFNGNSLSESLESVLATCEVIWWQRCALRTQNDVKMWLLNHSITLFYEIISFNLFNSLSLLLLNRKMWIKKK